MISAKAGFFGTDICVVMPTGRTAEEILEYCGYYDSLFSKFRVGSDIWKINRDCGKWVQVSEDTVDIISKAEELRRRTKGAFDILAGSTFGTDDMVSYGSKAETRVIDIDIPKSKIRIPCGAAADLGGIAKGYICDKIVRALSEKGVNTGLLNFGGNIYAIGQREDGPWQIGLRSPWGSHREILGVLRLQDACMITSGDYERKNPYTGDSHILNPKTGKSAKTDIASATVLSENACEADALATAIVVLGLEGSVDIIKEFPGVRLIIALKSGEVLKSPELEFM